MKKKNQLHNMLFCIVVSIAALSVYKVEGINSDPKVLISNMLIIILSLIFMVAGDRYNYSLNKIFMLFSFFFFGIAPALQYQYGVTMWRGPMFSDKSYLRINIIIIVILLTYQGLYYIFSRIKYSNSYKKSNMTKKESIIFSKKALLLLSILSMIVTLYFNSFNLINLFFRAGSEVERASINQSTYLIYSNFIRPIPVITLILFKINKIKDKKLELTLILIVLLTNFPTSRARFYIAALYIALSIVYIKQVNKKYLFLNKGILIGLLIIFPFLDQARSINQFSDLKLGLDFQMFLQGHFDSFQMFMRVVDENYITMGSQLLTSLFFFVPRSIWPDKSVGSGYLMSSEIGLSYDNISMNYFGEGYINFGYLGIFLFVCILAFVNARLDKIYWHNLNKYDLMSPYYLFFMGLEFFILRGDLLSSIAFTIGILTSIYFVNRIAMRKNKSKELYNI